MPLKLLLLFLTALFGLNNALQAQLCTGSLGDPVVNITFGSGQNPGPPQATTNYQYVTTDCPIDGQYIMRNASVGCFSNTWHTITDHTGDPNGYFMLANASYSPGDFYVETVSGLCGNTSYEFAAWVVNVQKPISCNGNSIKPNLTFSIETTSGTKLATFNSGDINLTNQPEWKQYGTFFTTPPNVSTVVIRLTNNAPGGCGNDIGLDDITFKPCGASITAAIEGTNATQLDICAGNNSSRRFVASIPGGYVRPELQWQQSRDGGQTWEFIAGAKSAVYEWKETTEGIFYYRALVAEQGNINAASCRIASKPIKIIVAGLPEIIAPGEVSFCEGSLLQFDILAKLRDTAGLRISWNGPAAAGLSLNETPESNGRKFRLSKPVAALADTGWYNITITTGAGCNLTHRVHLTGNSKPQAKVAALGPVCAGRPVQLSGSSAGNSTGDTYQWKWGAGNVSNDPVINPVLGPAGEYEVAFEVTNALGCISEPVRKNVQVHPMPKALFALPDVCLADAAANFTNLSEVVGGPASYRWLFGDAADPAAGSTDKNPGYRYRAVGNYPVTLSVTSAEGCTADTTQLFTVNGSQPKSLFTLNNATIRCSADTVVLRNKSTVDFGNITRIEIFWKGDGDEQAITMDGAPAPEKEYRFSYAPFISAGVQKFTIRMVAYSGESCMDQQEQEISIQQSPELVFDALEPLCQGAPAFTLVSARELTGVLGQGVYSGPGVDGQGRFNPALPGEHLITYRFTTQGGCVASAQQSIQVWPLPQIQAGPDKTVVAGGSVTLAATASGEGLQFRWSPAIGLSDAAALQPIASPEVDLLYTLTATTSQGCTASDEVAVSVISELYIPNAFTPNGDGINDTWQVPYLESMPDAEVRVYNRYGQEVYVAQGAARAWDGRVGGKDQPTGAFVYMLKLKGGKILRGTLMLVR
jgi:gliding motility-associated-like protein